MADGTAPVVGKWRNSTARQLVASLTYPLVYLLNRPSFSWFGNAVYDFALQCNGMNVTFDGRHGLTASEERFLATFMARRSGGVFFDVGANHGAYAAMLRSLVPGADIYAFEPHPVTYSVLQAALQDGSHLVNKGVGDSPGTMTLYDFAGNDGSTQASLSRESVALFVSDIVQHEVEVTTIDAFMAEHGIERIDFLKIDTEGYDLKVLQGARGALAAGLIRAIQFEFIPANIGTGVRMRDFFAVLEGFRIYRMCVNGSLLPLAPYSVKRCEIYMVQNLIALAPGQPG